MIGVVGESLGCSVCLSQAHDAKHFSFSLRDVYVAEGSNLLLFCWENCVLKPNAEEARQDISTQHGPCATLVTSLRIVAKPIA